MKVGVIIQSCMVL